METKKDNHTPTTKKQKRKGEKKRTMNLGLG